MAVTKLWSVTVRLGAVLDYATNHEKTLNPKAKYTMDDYQALRDVLAYAKNEEKTEHEFFCDGINCNVVTAREQFITVKEQYGKTDGIQAYHGYLSFKEQDITPEQAQKIGMEFANEVWGKRFQVVVTTHLNTKHLHCHFVINSVSFVDGLRCRDTSWFKFRQIADRICEKYNLHYTKKPERNRGNPYYIKQTIEGKPTRENNAKSAIDYAIEHSRTMADFKYIISKLGYLYNFNPKRKYWTITPRNSKKPIRLYRLGEDYTNLRIEERIKANRGNICTKPFFQQKTIGADEYKPKQSGSLQELYKYYCQKLGHSEETSDKPSYMVNYIIRDDLIRLKDISAQAILLSKYNINTDTELLEYQKTLEVKMKNLIALRTQLRNQLRRVSTNESQCSDIKKNISNISEKLKELRKQIKLCNDIATRSGVLKSNIEKIHIEEKNKEKEISKYE